MQDQDEEEKIQSKWGVKCRNVRKKQQQHGKRCSLSLLLRESGAAELSSTNPAAFQFNKYTQAQNVPITCHHYRPLLRTPAPFTGLLNQTTLFSTVAGVNKRSSWIHFKIVFGGQTLYIVKTNRLVGAWTLYYEIAMGSSSTPFAGTLYVSIDSSSENSQIIQNVPFKLKQKQLCLLKAAPQVFAIAQTQRKTDVQCNLVEIEYYTRIVSYFPTPQYTIMPGNITNFPSGSDQGDQPVTNAWQKLVGGGAETLLRIDRTGCCDYDFFGTVDRPTSCRLKFQVGSSFSDVYGPFSFAPTEPDGDVVWNMWGVLVIGTDPTTATVTFMLSTGKNTSENVTLNTTFGVRANSLAAINVWMQQVGPASGSAQVVVTNASIIGYSGEFVPFPLPLLLLSQNKKRKNNCKNRGGGGGGEKEERQGQKLGRREGRSSSSRSTRFSSSSSSSFSMVVGGARAKRVVVEAVGSKGGGGAAGLFLLAASNAAFTKWFACGTKVETCTLRGNAIQSETKTVLPLSVFPTPQTTSANMRLKIRGSVRFNPLVIEDSSRTVKPLIVVRIQMRNHIFVMGWDVFRTPAGETRGWEINHNITVRFSAGLWVIECSGHYFQYWREAGASSDSERNQKQTLPVSDVSPITYVQVEVFLLRNNVILSNLGDMQCNILTTSCDKDAVIG